MGLLDKLKEKKELKLQEQQWVLKTNSMTLLEEKLLVEN